MGNVNYTAKQGVKLTGLEVGAWLADNTPGTVGCSLGASCAPNLLSHPENFGHADWLKSNGNGVVVDDNTSIAPDGSLSMDRLTANGLGVWQYIEETKTTWTAGTVKITHSVYVKAGSLDSIVLYINNTSNGEFVAVQFSHTNGVYDNGTSISGAGASAVSSSSIEDLGIYRLSIIVTFNTAFGATDSVLIRPHLGWNSAVVGDIYMWGAQLTETAELQGYGSSHDISANDHALQVAGELTKSGTANNGDLQGWAGFTVNDYLHQVYDSALDPGTNPFFYMCWAKFSANTAINTLFERDSSTTAQRVTAALQTDGTIDFTVDDNTTVRTASTVNAYDDGVWRFFAFVYDGDGGVSIYVNGVLDGTATGAALLTMSNTSAVYRVGLDVQDANPAGDMSISINKYAIGAITAAQIVTIYNYEKQLIAGNLAVKIIDQVYDLELSLNVATLVDRVISHPVISLNGYQETTFHRRDTRYRLNINRLTAADLPELRAFIRSVEQGEIFELDRYGTAESPDSPVNVIADPGFTENRNGVDDYYTLQINVREAS